MEPGGGYFDKDCEEILSRLDLNKQFTLKIPMDKINNMDRDQAISFAKYVLVSKAYAEQTFSALVKTSGLPMKD